MYLRMHIDYVKFGPSRNRVHLRPELNTPQKCGQAGETTATQQIEKFLDSMNLKNATHIRHALSRRFCLSRIHLQAWIGTRHSIRWLWSLLEWVALCCSAYQTHTIRSPHAATLCNTLQHTHYTPGSVVFENTTLLQHAATLCNTLQHTTANYSTLQHAATRCNTYTRHLDQSFLKTPRHCNTLQHNATHYNTHTRQLNPSNLKTPCACNMLQHAATRCNTLQHAATRCNTRHLNSSFFKTRFWHLNPSYSKTPCHCDTLRHAATHCNMLQNTATRCNTHTHGTLIRRFWRHHVLSTSLPTTSAPHTWWTVLKSQLYSHCIRTQWRRVIKCLKLQVIFRKRATVYRALSQKMTCRDKVSYDSMPLCSTFFSNLFVYLVHLHWYRYNLLHLECHFFNFESQSII